MLFGRYQCTDCTCFAQAARLGNTTAPGFIDEQQIGLELERQDDGCTFAGIQALQQQLNSSSIANVIRPYPGSGADLCCAWSFRPYASTSFRTAGGI